MPEHTGVVGRVGQRGVQQRVRRVQPSVAQVVVGEAQAEPRALLGRHGGARGRGLRGGGEARSGALRAAGQLLPPRDARGDALVDGTAGGEHLVEQRARLVVAPELERDLAAERAVGGHPGLRHVEPAGDVVRVAEAVLRHERRGEQRHRLLVALRTDAERLPRHGVGAQVIAVAAGLARPLHEQRGDHEAVLRA